MDAIIQMIGTVGFPIVAYFVMAAYMMRKDEQHKAEIDLLSAAVQNNTIVMTEIRDRLDKLNKDNV